MSDSKERKRKENENLGAGNEMKKEEMEEEEEEFIEGIVESMSDIEEDNTREKQITQQEQNAQNDENKKIKYSRNYKHDAKRKYLDHSDNVFSSLRNSSYSSREYKLNDRKNGAADDRHKRFKAAEHDNNEKNVKYDKEKGKNVHINKNEIFDKAQKPNDEMKKITESKKEEKHKDTSFDASQGKAKLEEDEEDIFAIQEEEAKEEKKEEDEKNETNEENEGGVAKEEGEVSEDAEGKEKKKNEEKNETKEEEKEENSEKTDDKKNDEEKKEKEEEEIVEDISYSSDESEEALLTPEELLTPQNVKTDISGDKKRKDYADDDMAMDDEAIRDGVQDEGAVASRTPTIYHRMKGENVTQISSTGGDVFSSSLSPVISSYSFSSAIFSSSSSPTFSCSSSSTVSSSSSSSSLSVLAMQNAYKHRLSARDRSLIFGCERVENFKKLNKISEGTYGAVYRALNIKNNQIVALKHIKYIPNLWSEGFPITSLREISILLELKHQNIINVHEVVVGRGQNQVYMVMEYIEHELKALLDDNKPEFSNAERKCLLLQLLHAVDYMHKNWVVHRDLKTSNLLYSNKGVLKVCDFGMARKFGDPIKPYTHNVVTLWYRAPELLCYQQSYTEAVDIWSVGCIFGEMILGKPLFPGHGEADTLNKIFALCGSPTEETWPGFSNLPHIKSGKFFSKVPSYTPSWREVFFSPSTHIAQVSATLSDAGLNLLQRMLCLCPQKRITAAEAISHEYFREKPKSQVIGLMPTVPETNSRVRRKRRTERSLEDEEKKQQELFHDAAFRFGERVDAAKFLNELEQATKKN